MRNDSDRPPLWRRPGPWLAAIALVPLALWPMGYLGREHDDALYFLAAQALREGRYRLWFLPGQPPITNLTPGFPAFLAPFAFLFPDNPAACQAAAGLAHAAALAAAWLFFRRRFSPPTALLLTALTAWNPLSLARVGVVMPEGLFLAGALLFLDRFDGRRPAAAGVWLAALYLVRPAALPLWGAVGLSLALRRRWRDLAWAAAAPAAAGALWALWSRAGGGTAEAIELGALYGGKGAADGLLNVSRNFLHMARAWGATALPLFAARGPAAPVLGAALLAGAAAGLCRALRRDRSDATALFLVGSLAMHLLWPWWYDRYLFALLPFLLFYLARALEAAFPRPARSRAILAAVLVVSFLGQGVLWFKDRRARATPELEDTYAWIRARTAVSDGFVSLFYGRDLIYTRRVFLPPVDALDARGLAGALARRGARYVLWERSADLGFTDDRNAVTSAIDRLGVALKDERWFRPVHRDASGRAVLYERRPDA